MRKPRLVHVTSAAAIVVAALSASGEAAAAPPYFSVDEATGGPLQIAFDLIGFNYFNNFHDVHVDASATVQNTLPGTLHDVKILAVHIWTDEPPVVPDYQAMAYDNVLKRWVYNSGAWSTYTVFGGNGPFSPMYFRPLGDAPGIPLSFDRGGDPTREMSNMLSTDEVPTFDLGDLAPGDSADAIFTIELGTYLTAAQVEWAHDAEWFIVTATPPCAWNGGPDTDGDGELDACDDDIDGDGVVNGADNCADIANAGQDDLDGDGLGDVCDDDLDGDGIVNGGDNCADVVNPGQENLDGDALGDACDDDLDGDGIVNGADNCPLAANVSQADADADGLGNACDPTCRTFRRGLLGTVNDSMLSVGNPNMTYGGSTTFVSGGVVTETKHGLLKFTMPGVPLNAIVTSGTVNLTVHHTNNGTGTVRVHRINNAWVEGTVSWNNFAGAFNPTVAASASSAAASPSFDITALVQAWVSNPATNFGMLFEQDAAPPTTFFNSSEYAIAASRPRLVVCYVIPG